MVELVRTMSRFENARGKSKVCRAPKRELLAIEAVAEMRNLKVKVRKQSIEEPNQKKISEMVIDKKEEELFPLQDTNSCTNCVELRQELSEAKMKFHILSEELQNYKQILENLSAALEMKNVMIRNPEQELELLRTSARKREFFGNYFSVIVQLLSFMYEVLVLLLLCCCFCVHRSTIGI